MEVEIIEGDVRVNYCIMEYLHTNKNSFWFVYAYDAYGKPMMVRNAITLPCHYSDDVKDINKFCDLVYETLSSKNIEQKFECLLILSEEKIGVAKIMEKYFQMNCEFYNTICEKIVISAWNPCHFDYPVEYKDFVMV